MPCRCSINSCLLANPREKVSVYYNLPDPFRLFSQVCSGSPSRRGRRCLVKQRSCGDVVQAALTVGRLPLLLPGPEPWEEAQKPQGHSSESWALAHGLHVTHSCMCNLAPNQFSSFISDLVLTVTFLTLASIWKILIHSTDGIKNFFCRRTIVTTLETEQNREGR